LLTEPASLITLSYRNLFEERPTYQELWEEFEYDAIVKWIVSNKVPDGKVLSRVRPFWYGNDQTGWFPVKF
jgi:hypothetical protein